MQNTFNISSFTCSEAYQIMQKFIDKVQKVCNFMIHMLKVHKMDNQVIVLPYI